MLGETFKLQNSKFLVLQTIAIGKACYDYSPIICNVAAISEVDEMKCLQNIVCSIDLARQPSLLIIVKNGSGGIFLSYTKISE